MVTTLDKLEELVAVLQKASMIAVDLENHDFRSYYGFLCLMQISTQEEDFVIDLLQPEIREALGEKLNRIFLDATKLKIFHGAGQDVKWLQRDFGIYVINMIDTSKVLYFFHGGGGGRLPIFFL